MGDNPILWEPSDEKRTSSAMYRFMTGQGHDDYESLHRWSIDEPAAFWQALCEFCDIRFATPPRAILLRPDRIMDAGWFDGGELEALSSVLKRAADQGMPSPVASRLFHSLTHRVAE